MTEKSIEARSFRQLSTDLLDELKQKHYGTETLGNYRRALSRIGSFMDEEGFHIYTEEVGEAFISTYISRPSISKSHVSFTHTVVRRLNDVNAGICYQLIKPKSLPTVPSEYLEVLESYLHHCLTLKNKERTLSWKRKICSMFLRVLADLGCTAIKDINTDYVCRAIAHYENKDAYAVIRAFLRHLYETKRVKLDYSGIIPKHKRGKILPTTYSIDEVMRLEAAVDRTSKVGIRDYAVLLLVTRLGLRSGDIAGLTYDKVDFTRHTIMLTQEKTNQPLTLPLLPEIQEAIEEYIRFARPCSDSNFIFLSANAPHERMTTSIMRHSLSNYFSASGINTFRKKHGPHSLRSSLASSMINDGTPYEVVRCLLGHSDPDAIKHYAKVDIENLRRYAIDIPPPTGEFERLLAGGCSNG